jgi:hypothetical protein
MDVLHGRNKLITSELKETAHLQGNKQETNGSAHLHASTSART